MCVKQLIAVIMALGKNLKRFKGENGAKIETTRELRVKYQIKYSEMTLSGFPSSNVIEIGNSYLDNVR